MPNRSDEGYKRLNVVLVNLIILSCMWLTVIFFDPQSYLNPFKPQQRTVLALALSVTPTPDLSLIIAPTFTETAAVTNTPTSTSTATPTSTLTSTPVPTLSYTPPTVIPRIAPPTPTKPAVDAPTTGKWIDVDIGDQTISAFSGGTLLKKVSVSTGVASHPTVVGRFAIYQKLESQTMSGGNRFTGDYYFLPGVPDVMYFYAGYAIHGTYWHHNFGHPMSHGCVNLTKDDAKWFFGWAEVGTPVITHY